MYSLHGVIGLQHLAIKSPVVNSHAFIVSSPYQHWPLEPQGVYLTALQLHCMTDCFLILEMVGVIRACWCSVALQYLANDCLPSRLLILWENLYCTLLTAGDIFTERSNLVSYLVFNKQPDQQCHKDFRRALWLQKPQTLRSAPFPFSPLLMKSQGGFPSSPPLLAWWPSSIAALKRALLSNHCCPAESLLCPQSHPYVLLLNYPG